MTVLTVPQLIAKMRDLPHAVIDRALPDAAQAIDKTLRETMGAQQTPFGEPWPPRKVGTAPVLVHAVDALTVSVVGRTIFAVIRGIESRHHKGGVRGGVQRQMIPYVKDNPRKSSSRKAKTASPPRGVPPRILEAVREVFDKHFEEWKKEPPPS